MLHLVLSAKGDGWMTSSRVVVHDNLAFKTRELLMDIKDKKTAGSGKLQARPIL